jgi:putative Mn2+ efflux pump MntP
VPALLLVAVALGLSNFAGAVGIGVSGVRGRIRLRVGLVFGLFEAGMPLLGLLLGHSLAQALGHTARWTGAGILAACGGYAVLQATRGHTAAPGPRDQPGSSRGPGLARLLATGLALSIDNLAVGFALGTYHVSLPLAAAVIGAVSVALSLAGLEFGARIGARAGRHGELLGGLVLIGVGVALACGMT